jgi:thiol-disulfide isomerase/thioredoxin
MDWKNLFVYIIGIMPRIEDFIFTRLKPYKFYITTVVIVLIFLIVSIFAYKNFYDYFSSANTMGSDVANTGIANPVAKLMLFHVDWCPHCVKAMPEWQSFCSEYNGKIVNGYLVQCLDNNCTENENVDTKVLMDDYSISSFPTVVLIKENKRYDFDAKITRYSLEQFVQSSTK